MKPVSPKSTYRLLKKGQVVSQFLFLLLFFFLFLKTDYTGSDSLEYAVNILFRIDPLLALSVMLAVKTLVALMLPALVVVVLSLLFGRAFCGWACPMGGLLDGWRFIFRVKRERRPTILPGLPSLLLVFVLVSALFGFPLAGYVDPFSILVRGLSQAVYPGLNDVSVSFFTFTYQYAPDAVNRVTEPVYGFLRDTVLPIEQKYFQFGLVSLVMLAALFAAEHGQRRFFCRTICPLGALLGWVTRLGLLSVDGGNDECASCRHCAQTCRMGAIDAERRIDLGRCVLCMDCFTQCPRQIISFGARLPLSRNVDTSLSRRRFLSTASAAVILPSVLGTRSISVRADPLLIRPPGARPEKEFLQLCVRCGQCMQVCITNALQPVMLRAGIEGVFSPYLVARTGYCEFNCTLCGQVCPTGAIAALSVEDKHRFKIGSAWFDKNFCLPYARGVPCIVCEEHCPTPDKAIKFRVETVRDGSGVQRRIKQPYVIDELCIGCGICETRCPLPGRSGIIVTSDGEVRHPDNSLSFPSTGGGLYG